MAPSAPIYIVPTAGQWFLRTSALTVTIDATTPANQLPIAQTLEYTINGGASWVTTGVTWSGSWTQVAGKWRTGWTIAANTFADEATIQLRARYNDFDLGFSFYGYQNVRAAAQPGAPTITAPASLAVVGKTPTVTWTSPKAQDQYDVEVRTATGGGGSVVYASGLVTDTAQSVAVTMDVTGVTRYIRVRYAYHGILSPYTERQVSTTFAGPATPTFTTSKIDPNGFGISDTILFTITNPAPSGGQPAVTEMWVEYRKQGSSDPWVMIDSSIGLTTPFRWRAPHGSWEFRVTAYGASLGTSTVSATGQPQTVTLKGVLLNLASTPLTGIWMLFNGDEAEETYEVESALIQYAGRPFPVVEFGDAASNTISVASLSLKTRDELLRLQTMLTARDVVLYRDRRGRRLYGLMTLTGAVDKSFGYEIGLRVDRLDYTNPIEIGPN